MAEGPVSWWWLNLAWPKRQQACCAWVWHEPVALSGPSRGEPSRMEQWLCRPTGQGFGRPAMLLLDHGVEKPSMI
jgi:hypothetical protein